jgi:hypothetical protein
MSGFYLLEKHYQELEACGTEQSSSSSAKMIQSGRGLPHSKTLTRIRKPQSQHTRLHHFVFIFKTVMEYAGIRGQNGPF